MTAWLRAASLALAWLGGTAGAWAATDELASLKQEIARLAARVAELEARLAATPAAAIRGEPAEAVRGGPVATLRGEPVAAVRGEPVEPRLETADTAWPGIVRAPATSAPPRELSVGGRVKLDVIHSDVSAGGGTLDDILLVPGNVPLDGQGGRHQTEVSARASRFWIKDWLPTALGDAGAYLEFDLFGDGGNQRVSNGYGVRLRHAYAELGGLLFGQAYSTFVHVGALPELNDDGINVGALNVRQPQVRYTHALHGGTLSIALENPETTLRSVDGRRLTPADDRWPDMVLRYAYRADWGDLALAFLGREIRIDDRATGARDRAAGGAVNLAGVINLGTADILRFSAVGGNAVGRYANLNSHEAGRLLADGTIGLTWLAGGYLSWQHFWSRAWRTNLTTGYTRADDTDAVANENEALYSLHANILWSPVLSTTLGLEWIHAYRRRFDGRAGHLNRVQFSAVHKF